MFKSAKKRVSYDFSEAFWLQYDSFLESKKSGKGNPINSQLVSIKTIKMVI